jgi:hypothetical protein
LGWFAHFHLPIPEVTVKKAILAIVAISFSLTNFGAAHSETREQWIELGARIHGAFGAFIPVGIRMASMPKS